MSCDSWLALGQTTPTLTLTLTLQKNILSILLWAPAGCERATLSGDFREIGCNLSKISTQSANQQPLINHVRYSWNNKIKVFKI